MQLDTVEHERYWVLIPSAVPHPHRIGCTCTIEVQYVQKGRVVGAVEVIEVREVAQLHEQVLLVKLDCCLVRTQYVQIQLRSSEHVQ